MRAPTSPAQQRSSWVLLQHFSSQPSGSSRLCLNSGVHRGTGSLLPSEHSPILAHLLPIRCPPACLPAETQRAPDKPFLKLDTAGGAVILGFTTLDERNTAVDVLVAVAQVCAFCGHAL